jgi:hypothetical protein
MHHSMHQQRVLLSHNQLQLLTDTCSLMHVEDLLQQLAQRRCSCHTGGQYART